MTDKELKPCPFCGSKNVELKDGGRFWVECNICGARLYGVNTPEMAMAAWNMRTEAKE